jgi:transcription factor IIIB 90 kDa subunit
MNDGACAACGQPTVFEEDLGSAICTSCGTLSNPSQNILDSHLEHIDSSGRDYQPQSIPIAGGSTLKGRDGRSLAGQDKEARDRRNTVRLSSLLLGRIES